MADEVEVHAMDRQAQEPGVGQDATEAETGQLAEQLRQQSATATARLHEQVELLEVVAALQTGEVTINPLCVIQPRGTELVLTGEIDLHNVGEVQSHILTWLHDADNYLDLTGVGFIDSMGLSMVLHVRALAMQRGAHLHITCSSTVYPVLEVAGLTESLSGLTVTRCD